MKNLFAGLIVLGISLSLTANAITIDLIQNQTQLNPGDTLAVDVRISGLNDTNTPSLGVYDLDFSYDANLFHLNNIVWGDSTLGNQLDLGGFGSLQEINVGSGWLNLFELSFDNTSNLDLFQAGEFTLFSVLFNAIDIGVGNFSLTANTLGDAFGNNFSVDAITGTQVIVDSTSVPEPSSLLLLLSMLGVISLRSLRTKK